MLRAVPKILLVAATMMLGIIPGADGATHGRSIVDAKYSIKFYAPSSWKHCVVTTTDTGSSKLVVQDVSGSTVVGVVAVLVVAGRSTNASAIAAGVLSASPGSRVLGSGVQAFGFGKAEELRYTLVESGVTVYGIAEAFYQRKHTYIVAFYSISARVNTVARSAVMNSWGV